MDPGVVEVGFIRRSCREILHSGDAIGPYTLLRLLGRGAYGEVWLAERDSSLLTTQVALNLPLDAGAETNRAVAAQLFADT